MFVSCIESLSMLNWRALPCGDFYQLHGFKLPLLLVLGTAHLLTVESLRDWCKAILSEHCRTLTYQNNPELFLGCRPPQILGDVLALDYQSIIPWQQYKTTSWQLKPITWSISTLCLLVPCTVFSLSWMFTAHMSSQVTSFLHLVEVCISCTHKVAGLSAHGPDKALFIECAGHLQCCVRKYFINRSEELVCVSLPTDTTILIVCC